MSILSAQTIRSLCVHTFYNNRSEVVKTERCATPLIEPFVNGRNLFEGMSYGLSSASYDMRLAECDAPVYTDTVTDESYYLIGPGEFVLASTIERVCLPDNVVGFIHDKSSRARVGLSAFNTLIDPGFRGFVTLELVNNSKQVIHIKKGAPIVQMVFHYLDTPTDRPYEGKYQDQRGGPQPAIYEK